MTNLSHLKKAANDPYHGFALAADVMKQLGRLVSIQYNYTVFVRKIL